MIKLNDWKEYLRKNKMLSFTFVRHPFERLVSAYKNKVLQERGTKLFKEVTRESGESTRKFTDDGHKILQWYKDNHSFPAFIDLVLNGYKGEKVSNGHWNPITPRCRYCDVEYDVIGRMETFDEDLRYIVMKKNLHEVLPLEELSLSMNSAKSMSTKTAKDYFSQISKEQIVKLYKYYNLDFELFGYDVTPYL